MRSSLGQLKDFFSGVIWQDIKDELNTWLEDIRNALEDPGKTLFMEDIKRLQGNAEAIRNVLTLENSLILNKEDELKEEGK